MRRIAPETAVRLLVSYNLFFWFSRELARPAISIALSDRIGSAGVVGLLLSAQSFLPILFAIPSTALGDRYGQSRILHLGSALTLFSGLSYLASGLSYLPNLTYLILVSLGQIVSGIAWMIVWIALQALTAQAAQSGGEGGVRRSVNNLVLSVSIGSLLGPLAAGHLANLSNPEWTWLAYFALCMLQFTLSRIVLHRWEGSEPAAGQRRQPASRNGVRERRAKRRRRMEAWGTRWAELGGPTYGIVLAASAVILFGSELRGSYLPAYLRSGGLSPDNIGTIVTSGALAACLVRLLFALPFFRPSNRTMVLSALLFTVSGVASLALLPPGNGVAIASVLLGLGGGIGEPALIVMIVECAAASRRGLAVAGRVLVNRAAMFLAPLSSGLAVQWSGGRAGFALLGAALGTFSLYIANKLIIKRKRGIHHDHSASAED